MKRIIKLVSILLTFSLLVACTSAVVVDTPMESEPSVMTLDDQLKELLEDIPEDMQDRITSELPENFTQEDLDLLEEKLANMNNRPEGGERPSGGKSGHHHDSGPSETFITSERIELDGNVDYKDGIFQGQGPAYNGDLTVEITIEDNTITRVEVIEHNETPGFFEEAFEKLPTSIISSQSTSVDTLSGATRSSEGIILAVEDALSKAK